jgi:hypothetical protein
MQRAGNALYNCFTRPHLTTCCQIVGMIGEGIADRAVNDAPDLSMGIVTGLQDLDAAPV